MLDTAAPELDRFRATVMADPDLQQYFAEFHDANRFEDEAQAFAAQRGIAVRQKDLIARPDPLGVLGDAPRTGSEWPPLPWLPLRLDPASGAVDWIHFAGLPLRQSFYADSLRRVRGRPFNQLFRYRTPFDAFVNAPRTDSLAPTGFIFHMSRCGSTLVSQMLAASDANIVVSEAEPLDMAIQLPLLVNIDPATQIEVVRAMVAALGRNRSGEARRYFIKLDSWHTLALPALRQAFPETPWIFLYRDPVEVLVSQMRMRGAQTTQGVLPPQIFGIGADETNISDAEYAARVLATTCEAAIGCSELGGGMLVEYRELPEAFFTRILPHFGVVPDEAEAAQMREASHRNSKTPDQPFRSDSEEKRAEADASVHAVAEQYLSGVYARLQALRAAE